MKSGRGGGAGCNVSHIIYVWMREYRRGKYLLMDEYASKNYIFSNSKYCENSSFKINMYIVQFV